MLKRSIKRSRGSHRRLSSDSSDPEASAEAAQEKGRALACEALPASQWSPSDSNFRHGLVLADLVGILTVFSHKQ